MIAYLLKMILCSAILYGYYWIALRNKLFHQWNRFYLLAIVPLSLGLPLLRFEWQKPAEPPTEIPLRLLEVVSDGNMRFEEAVRPEPAQFDPALLLYAGYAVVATVILLSLLRSIFRLRSLGRQFPVVDAEGVQVVLAPVKGTPFTFFRRIFWNPDIDLASDGGRQILQHELVHVREKHSADKLFLQLTTTICWFNPVFWFLRNEIHLLHEFIADQQSVKDKDAGTLARLILQAAYPGQYSRLANPFFHHAIKRRLHMLNQLQSAKVRYFGRVLALPLLALVGFAFAVRAQQQKPLVPVVAQTNGKKFTVMIDAGHGRMDNGAWNGASLEGVSEDELVLAIAQKIRSLNADPNLDIVFTRENERVVDLKSRVLKTIDANADLFISLHIDAEAAPDGGAARNGTRSGISILLSRDSARFVQSRQLGSLLGRWLKETYATNERLQQRKAGTWVLDKAPCPAALVQLGYITSERDRRFLSSNKNQEKIAYSILNAIAGYRLRPQQAGSGNAAHPAEPAAMPQPATTPDAGESATARPGAKSANDEINPITELYAAPDGTLTVVRADGTREQLAQKGARTEKGFSLKASRIVIKGETAIADGQPVSLTKPNTLSAPAPRATPRSGKPMLYVWRGVVYSDKEVWDAIEKAYPNSTYAGLPVVKRIKGVSIEEAAQRFQDTTHTYYEVINPEHELAQLAAEVRVARALGPNFKKVFLPRSGDTLSVESLRKMPVKMLVDPYEFGVESYTFAIDSKNGDIHEYKISDGRSTEGIRKLLDEATPGRIITVESRLFRASDGTLKKAPSVVYFVK